MNAARSGCGTPRSRRNCVSTTEYTAVVRATPEASDITENSVNIGVATRRARASLKATRRAYPM